MLRSLTGFVIRTQPYRETHKLITLFTKELGKVNAISRGANRPNSRMVAISQPFVYANFLTYVSRGLSTIQQGEVLNSYRNIREDIHKTTYASYIAELTWKSLKDQESMPYLYSQFKHTLDWISNHDEYMIPVIMYEFKVYKYAGILPVVTECVLCGNVRKLQFFSINEGGVLCKSCFRRDEHAMFLSKTIIKLLQVFSSVGIDQVGTISIKRENEHRIRTLMDEYYDRYGGYPLKTRKVLRQLDQL